MEWEFPFRDEKTRCDIKSGEQPSKIEWRKRANLTPDLMKTICVFETSTEPVWLSIVDDDFGSAREKSKHDDVSFKSISSFNLKIIANSFLIHFQESN